MTYVETKMIEYHVEIKYLSLSLVSKPFNKDMNMQHISNVINFILSKVHPCLTCTKVIVTIA